MKFVIQIASNASVAVENQIIGSIDYGYMVLIGIENADTTEIADKMIKKMLGLRIFKDENGKTNLNLSSVQGSLLLISQFTLYADCSTQRIKAKKSYCFHYSLYLLITRSDFFNMLVLFTFSLYK